MTHPDGQPVLLRNARLVLPDQVAENSSLLVEAGRIVRVFDSKTDQLPSVDSVLDLNGLTLFPGFIDIHIHGAAGVDTMAANVDDLRRVAEFLARHGVTAWVPTLVPASDEEYERSISVIEQAVAQTSVCDFLDAAANHGLKSVPLARVLGVHYEGPFVNSEQCGALHREYFRTFKDAADLNSLPRIKHEGAVHLMTLAPEIEGGIALIKELRRQGWIVSIGHTRATVEVLDAALESGARHMTHFMNAMTPLHHRAPGPVGWGLINDEVTCDVIADGVHLDPSILKLIMRSKTAERISLISDAVSPTGLGDGEYQIWGETIRVRNGRTENARGSIAGSVITMLDAVRLMLSLGASESAVARMASLNPARLLGIDKDCGSIEEGKRADLVALDRDGQARMIVIGGVAAGEL
ncbi:MAG: N-acetylglucosamine-6-phosphate deacetylase [Blastocatellia bacterium]|nr:N-acetylglucosamine-6-phosphate deacetylase [Blastocatellia bacterium]